MYSKSSCPICNESIAENLLQSHVERCLEKPEPRKVSKRGTKRGPKHKLEGSEEEEDIEPDMFNATPEIIIDEDDEVICSTPLAAEKENRRMTTRKKQQK